MLLLLLLSPLRSSDLPPISLASNNNNCIGRRNSSCRLMISITVRQMNATSAHEHRATFGPSSALQWLIKMCEHGVTLLQRAAWLSQRSAPGKLLAVYSLVVCAKSTLNQVLLIFAQICVRLRAISCECFGNQSTAGTSALILEGFLVEKIKFLMFLVAGLHLKLFQLAFFMFHWQYFSLLAGLQKVIFSKSEPTLSLQLIYCVLKTALVYNCSKSIFAYLKYAFGSKSSNS